MQYRLRLAILVVSLLVAGCGLQPLLVGEETESGPVIDGGGEGDQGPAAGGSEVASGDPGGGDWALVELHSESFGDDTLGCAVGSGCFGDPCKSASDCLSGWCVDHMGNSVCSVMCQEECPSGWSCQQVAGTDPDVIFICVSNFGNLCRPCVSGADCKGTGENETVCVDYGPEGAFCGGGCLVDTDCPWGFVCGDVETVGGVVSRQCVNAAGSCPCTDKAVRLSLWTECQVTTEWGSCKGKRVCSPEGLSQCDAASAAAESCNGLDDDCDDEIDEGTCNDGNDCTTDSCLAASGCLHEPLSGIECKDGDICSVGDHCEAGVCVGSPVLCNDSNPCTDDSCDGVGGCKFAPNQLACDDGNPCTVADQCSQGNCQGVAIACDCQSDKECLALEDGNKCNGTLYCDLESLPYQCRILPDSVVECPQPPAGPDGWCQQATCEAETGKCLLIATNEGTGCNDANPCTLGESCKQGQCGGGTPLFCADNNPCTSDSCDPAKGCIFTANQEPCSDDDPCTVGDQCQLGQCLPGKQLLKCDDGNPCNGIESCLPANGCLPGQPLVCDDGNACNGVESCSPVSGCLPGKPPNCNDNQPCTADGCDPKLGCLNTPVDGPCNDGNACTLGDSCKQGKCIHSSLLNCNDSNVCTSDSCDPLTGCLFILNNAPCNDGDLCSTGDHCHLGQCIGGGQLPCNDNNPCTDDSCQPTSGCTFTPNQLPCSDNNLCTQNDQCANGWCLPGATVVCDDSNPCTNDACHPKQGCTFLANQLPCNDGSLCTDGDQCADMKCQPGPELDCDDSNQCTSDSCLPKSGCQNEKITGVCNDFNACTTNEFCHVGVCGGGVVVTCDDGNVCTDDGCHPATGCVHDFNQQSCNDLDPCTVGDKCDQGQCQVGPDQLACSDGNECTGDLCQAGIGCLYPPVVNNTPCLNGQGSCQQGSCVPTVVPGCNQIFAANPASPSGVYTVDPDGAAGPAAPFQVFCEMGLDQGGWTLVMSVNTADGHKSFLPHTIWTTTSEYGNFASRWSNDYKSRAATTLSGTALLLIVRNHNAGEGGAIAGWRSWNLAGAKAFQDFFTVSMGSAYANSTGGCNSGFSGDGRKQTSGIRTAGQAALWDTFTNQGDEIYTNSYYGACGDTQDGFRLSTHYRWANNSNVGLGLQMDGTSSSYNLEAGAIFYKDTYTDPQRQCCSCGGCSANSNGSLFSSGSTKAAIGTDHESCHCSVGVSYRYEWYIR